jgi:hypothetical protein
MSIGIGSSWTDDSNDDIGPFSHWDEDEDMYSSCNHTKEELLQLIKSLSIKDRNWILNNLKK